MNKIKAGVLATLTAAITVSWMAYTKGIPTPAKLAPPVTTKVTQMVPAAQPPLIDTIEVRDNPGGIITEFQNLVEEWNKRQYVVRIAGDCWSSCTLFTGVQKVCVNADAKLHFHAPFIAIDVPGGIRGFHPDRTAKMLAAYPKPIQNWIKTNGGLTEDWITLKGRELHRLVPICSNR